MNDLQIYVKKVIVSGEGKKNLVYNIREEENEIEVNGELLSIAIDSSEVKPSDWINQYFVGDILDAIDFSDIEKYYLERARD